MDDFEKYLSEKELIVKKDSEIERILKCNEWDYIDILEINPFKDTENLEQNAKRTYRKKTLLIHPDKVSNPQAPLAFDRLKKSEQVLCAEVTKVESLDNDTEKSLAQEKRRLLEAYKEAKTRVLNRNDLPEDISDKDLEEIKHQVHMLLDAVFKEEEIEKGFQRDQDMKKRNEELRIRKEREMKKKIESKWEDDRDERVQNWRSYVNKVEKKKHHKKQNLKKKVLA